MLPARCSMKQLTTSWALCLSMDVILFCTKHSSWCMVSYHENHHANKQIMIDLSLHPRHCLWLKHGVITTVFICIGFKYKIVCLVIVCNSWQILLNSTEFFSLFILIQHVRSCNWVTQECQMHVHPKNHGQSKYFQLAFYNTLYISI